jgi:hypothetical protein
LVSKFNYNKLPGGGIDEGGGFLLEWYSLENAIKVLKSDKPKNRDISFLDSSSRFL